MAAGAQRRATMAEILEVWALAPGAYAAGDGIELCRLGRLEPTAMCWFALQTGGTQLLAESIRHRIVTHNRESEFVVAACRADGVDMLRELPTAVLKKLVASDWAALKTIARNQRLPHGPAIIRAAKLRCGLPPSPVPSRHRRPPRRQQRTWWV
jgi:hypothetical protein